MTIKTTILTLFLSIGFYISNAQLPYNFSILQQEYTPLENATILTNEYWDDFDEIELEFPIGFDFQLFDQIINSLYVGSDFAEVMVTPSTNEGIFTIIAPYIGDLEARIDQSGNILSHISYVVEGAPGQRIFKGEWNNFGFYNDDLGQDFANYQFWLYEADGAIEFHYGPSALNNPLTLLFDDSPGPLVGLFDKFDSENETVDLALILNGEPASPNMTPFSDFEQIEMNNTLTGQPANGTVYRFERNIVNDLKNPLANIEKLTVYPTIAENALTLDLHDENAMYHITDNLGRIIVKKTTLINNTIDISMLNKGIYNILLIEKNGTHRSARFIKS